MGGVRGGGLAATRPAAHQRLGTPTDRCPAHDPGHGPQPRCRWPKPQGGHRAGGEAHRTHGRARPRPLAGPQDGREHPARAAAGLYLSIAAAPAERSAHALSQRARGSARPPIPVVRGVRPPARPHRERPPYRRQRGCRSAAQVQRAGWWRPAGRANRVRSGGQAFRPHRPPAGSRRRSRGASHQSRQEAEPQDGRRRPTGAAPLRLVRDSFPPPDARRAPPAPPRRFRPWRQRPDGRLRGLAEPAGSWLPETGRPPGARRHRRPSPPERPRLRAEREVPRAWRACGGPSGEAGNGVPAAAVR